MEILELTLLLLAALFISSIAEQMLPRFSLPLVQIGIGLVIALALPNMAEVEIDPELFLVLFIAPLLYDETRHVDKVGLVRNIGPVVSLAVGLVLVCVLAVGFTLHWIEPSIPLAAAFALGAALGPTDAAAVVALGKEVNMTARQGTWLSGEALINDASGVVSFQFAIAAAVTGTFNAVDAGVSFLYTFFVGLLVGIILGFAIRLLQRTLRARGFESTTSHIVIEVLTPFVVFLAGEGVSASGILAVVAAGLVINVGSGTSSHRISAMSARLNVVSSSVWEVLIFVINGVVFVMLGMQLPSAVSPTWEDVSFNTAELIGMALLVTLIICVLRFIWLFVLEAVVKPEIDHEALEEVVGNPTLPAIDSQDVAQLAEGVPELDPFADPLLRETFEIRAAREASRQVHEQAVKKAAEKRSVKEIAMKALATTLAGPKGAVTLSIIFSIPYLVNGGAAFPARDMLIFLASAVILLTLLMANFLLPVLAPKEEESEEEAREAFRDAEIAILHNVIAELREEKVPETAAATAIVIRRYRDRIKRLRADDVDTAAVHSLRRQVIDQQQHAVREAALSGEVSKDAAQYFASRLKSMQKKVLQNQEVRPEDANPMLKGGAARLPRVVRRLLLKLDIGTADVEDKQDIKHLVLITEQRAVDYLETKLSDVDEDVVNAANLLLIDHRTRLANLGTRIATQETTTLFDRPLIDIDRVAAEQREAEAVRVREIQAHAFRLELEEIQVMREQGRLTRSIAHDLREEVYLMQMDQADVFDEE